IIPTIYNADTLGIRPDLVGRPIGNWKDIMDPKFKRSDEHTSELQSLMRISYAVFCLTKIPLLFFFLLFFLSSFLLPFLFFFFFFLFFFILFFFSIFFFF